MTKIRKCSWKTLSWRRNKNESLLRKPFINRRFCLAPYPNGREYLRSPKRPTGFMNVTFLCSFCSFLAHLTSIDNKKMKSFLIILRILWVSAWWVADERLCYKLLLLLWYGRWFWNTEYTSQQFFFFCEFQACDRLICLKFALILITRTIWGFS